MINSFLRDLSNKRYLILATISLLITVLLFGCKKVDHEEKAVTAKSSQNVEQSNSTKPVNTPLTAKFQESTQANNTKLIPAKRMKARTWQEIKESGYINAVKLDWELESALPRDGTVRAFEPNLIEDFAKQHKLNINWQKAKNLTEMFRKLSTFAVDIIPRHLTVTKTRKKDFSFTYPLLRDNEVVISKENTISKKDFKELLKQGKAIEVTLPVDSAYIETVNQSFPHWQVNTVEAQVSSHEIADRLVVGNGSYTIIDGFAWEILRKYRDDIQLVYTIPNEISLAWAVNLNNHSFLHELNEFISVHHVMQVIEPNRTIDFRHLRKNKQPLRVITRNSPETYFLWRGELLGFEYELMRKFAEVNNVELAIVVAETYEEMLTLLIEGKGDVIAAGLSRSNTRKESLLEEKIKTSIRYNRVKEQLVAHAENQEITSLDDLKGRVISLRKSSSFWQTGQELAKKYGAIIEIANENISTEILINQVADKMIDLTIADSNLIAIENTFRSEILTPLTFKEDVPYAYLVRENNPELLAYLNEFIRKYYRGTFYNVVKNRYFYNEKSKNKYEKYRVVAGARLSPYDNIVKRHAKPYHFDWRLIVSQMYQESRFDPLATNSTGALGLMQMLPKTAAEIGVENLTEPEQAISSGIQYLDWTRDRFSYDLPIQEQIFFSLASYNAGYGHVKDAQRLAEKLGLRQDKWFNNVEKAMLLLQRRHYHQHARFGYVRGHEPVNYVRDIHQRYLSYIRITE